MRTRDEIINEIIECFSNDEDLFNTCIEELDEYNGYLADDRYFPMEEFNLRVAREEPITLAFEIFFSYDEDTYSTDASGRREYGKFNPNEPWFKWNGNGNLVSARTRDYTGWLDSWFVKALAENRARLWVPYRDDKLTALFVEYDNAVKGEKSNG